MGIQSMNDRVLPAALQPWLALLLGLALLTTAACTRRPLSAPPVEPEAMNRDTYVIGVDDRVTVTVWGNRELSISVPVRPDGRISVPLLDDVQAEGLQPMELKEVLTREFSEYVSNPHVTVIVNEMNSQQITLMGEVGRNTRIPLRKDLRVLEAIAAVGGFTNFADTDNVRIIRRRPDGTEEEYRFDYDAFIKGNAPGTNIILRSGDVIIVPE